MPIFWDFMYEKKPKEKKPLQQAYVEIEELPYIPEYNEKPEERVIIIDLIDEK